MLKKAFILSTAIFLLFLTIIIIFVSTGPTLPEGSGPIIDGVFQSELPELVTGETGTVKSGTISIWYESRCTAQHPKGTVLLIMGAGGSALGWTDDFMLPLLKEGYRVIRYDQRDTGMSDWLTNWDPTHPYTLEDMAADAVAVLDGCKVPRAHVVGISMGGMIAQRLAISHADRVHSLATIASSGYFDDPEIPQVGKKLEPEMLKLFLRYGLFPTEKNTVKLVINFIGLLRGDVDYPMDIKGIAESVLYELRKRKGLNPEASKHHIAAIEASGSLYGKLGNIKAPTLVIHGKADPIVSPKHAEKLAPLIPGATLMLVDGMGHDLPQPYLPKIHAAILANFRKAGHTTVPDDI